MVLLFLLLGFTEFLGGPYLFFKILFWLSIFPFLFGLFLLLLAFFKIKSTIKNVNNVFEENVTDKEKNNTETIHVDVKIKE